jgi:16S rRNA (guanine966-N2)-methyltransferase
MRIIAGKFRHRKLLTNPGQTTRPIIDRAKVRLFDLIRHELPGARVLDVFAGTGTLGIESLSRGAKSAVFCEADHRAHELLRKNTEVLKVTDDVLCWRVDVLRCSFRPKGTGDWTPYRAVFFDPPYKMADDLKPGTPIFRCLERLARPDTTTDNALLVIRTPLQCEPTFPPAWTTEMVFEVASMRIFLLRKNADAGPVETDEISDEEADEAAAD